MVGSALRDALKQYTLVLIFHLRTRSFHAAVSQVQSTLLKKKHFKNDTKQPYPGPAALSIKFQRYFFTARCVQSYLPSNSTV